MNTVSKFSSKYLYMPLAILLFLLLGPGILWAQSLSITPSTQAVPVNGSRTFDIKVLSPGVNSGVSLRMTLNTSFLRFSNLELDAGFTIVVGCSSGATSFSSGEICADAVQGVAFTEGQLIGTATVVGVSSGSQSMDFDAGTLFSDGATDTAFSGNVGTYTITNSLLPDTGLADEQPLLLAGLILLGLALLLNRVPILQGYAFFFLPKSRRTSITRGEERDAFESQWDK